MADIFISYARADRDKIEKLANCLKAQGYSVWWDRNLTGGVEFTQEIEEEITSAKAVIVAWSKSGSASPWVRDEASLARTQQKLFPIKLDDPPPPLGFQQFHTFDFSDWRGGENELPFESLVGSLRKRTDVAASPTHASITKNDKQLSIRLLGAAAAVFFVLVIAAVFFLRTQERASPGNEAIGENAGEIIDSGQTEDLAVGLGVIPFVNMSSDENQEFFADGLTEELLNWLANVEGLKVPGRTASFQFKGENLDFQEIGARLGVDYLLEGSVRRSENTIRITAQLIEAKSGMHLWSETYDRSMGDIFAIQDDVAQKVVTELLGEIPASGIGNPAAVGDVSPLAHQYYLEGSALWSQRRSNEAFEKFKKATEIDPNHWLAQAYLAVTGAYKYRNLELAPSEKENIKSAVDDALNKAEELRPKAADVLFARAWVMENMILTPTNDDLIDPENVSLYQDAVRTNPRLAEAIHALARNARTKDEQIELTKRVIELEPGHMAANFNLANYYMRTGEIEKARAVLRRYEALLAPPFRRSPDLSKLMGDWRDYYSFYLESILNPPSQIMDSDIVSMVLADLGLLQQSVIMAIDASKKGETVARSSYWRSRADLLNRNFDAALNKMDEAIEQETIPPWMPLQYARSLIYAGKPQAALDVILKLHPTVLTEDIKLTSVDLYDGMIERKVHFAALALEQLGRGEEAKALWLALLPELEKPIYNGWRRHIGRAIVFAQTGEPDRALSELDQAYDAGFRYLYSFFCVGCIELDFYESTGFFGSLVDDERFRAFVCKIERENAKFFAENTYAPEILERLKELALTQTGYD